MFAFLKVSAMINPRSNKNMRQFQVFYILILISIAKSSAQAYDYAKKGCNDTCGLVRIPYPFGIGANCSVNKWYVVDCNSSTPYLSEFNNMEVLFVSLEEQTITVSVSRTTRCRNSVPNSNYIPSTDLGESPFVFSGSHNVLNVEGCGYAAILDQQQAVIGGCSTICANDGTSNKSDLCFGLGCCRTRVPYNLQSYTLDLTGLERLGEDGACGSAFLANDWWLGQVIPPDFYSRSIYPKEKTRNASFFPITLSWFLTSDDFLVIPSCWLGESTRESYLYLGNGSSVVQRKCSCGIGRVGNPYLHYQCEESEDCRICRYSGGICQYGERYNGNPNLYCKLPAIGTPISSSSKSPRVGVMIGVGICMGMLLIPKFISGLHKEVKNTIAKRKKEKFFKRNGGLLLKQQESSKEGFVDKTILFTSKELETATNHFNENRILGRGGQGTVYKGMLADGRIVAVKKAKMVDESQLEQFINEVVILAQVSHRNVVQLLGCCLETEVPLLVSEFVSKGTLYAYIQDNTGDLPFSLNMRLQIATEVAGAVSYLHSETPIPIYHRDIKTTNILLDEKYRAKVSDFGTSRLVSLDQTHLTTLVKGTFGYFDPEYFQSSQFTEKSDVYSFGVVLLELFTREKPISLTRFGEHRNLATYFMFAMEEGRALSIFDPGVVIEDSKGVIWEIANLAMRCLNSSGKHRPTMKEVAKELEGMRMTDVSSVVQTSFEDANDNKDLHMFTNDRSTSTTMSFADNISE